MLEASSEEFKRVYRELARLYHDGTLRGKADVVRKRAEQQPARQTVRRQTRKRRPKTGNAPAVVARNRSFACSAQHVGSLGMRRSNPGVKSSTALRGERRETEGYPLRGLSRLRKVQKRSRCSVLRRLWGRSEGVLTGRSLHRDSVMGLSDRQDVRMGNARTAGDGP